MIYRKRKFNLFFLILLVLPSLFLAQPGTEDYKIFYYDNGNVSSEGNFIEGKPDGWWKTYYPSGELKSIGKRTNFELDSLWSFYNEEGIIESKINYEFGQKNGEEILFNEEGNQKEINNFVNGSKEGETLLFYNSGEKYRSIPFEENKEKGIGYEYAKDGRIITKVKYDQGYLRSIEKINRLDESGRKKGFWEILGENNKIKEEGNYTQDKRNGIFKFYDRKGVLERMVTYKNGIEVTESEQASVILDIKKSYYDSGAIKIIGSYDGDNKQGVFRQYDENGNIINAELYKKNQKIGEGLIDKNGFRQGPWILFYPSGEIQAQGEYVDNLKEGKWKYFYPSGNSRQVVQYRSGLPHGEWNWYYENGSSWREEIYRKGKEDGLMTEFDSIGNVILTGEYIDGYKNGLWLSHINDHKEEGEYIDGEKHGKWKYTYENGRKNFEGEFQGGIPVGKHVYYYSNGLKREEGKYSSGEKEGDWKIYDELGVVKNVLKYKQGIVVRINGQKVPQNQDLD